MVKLDQLVLIYKLLKVPEVFSSEFWEIFYYIAFVEGLSTAASG